MKKNNLLNLSCPIPINEYPVVTLAHGGGGTLSHQLISKMFYSQFDNEYLKQQHDSAVFNVDAGRLAFTTDSYVVKPIFFPGGNIGELAVFGTVNDLAVAGAEPRYISVGFILEEGFAMEELWEIVLSMKDAANKSGVKIVTGDTKVVDKGKGDKIYINTSGVGRLYEGVNISPLNCKPGDKIILNGRIAEHGIAVMASREGLEFETSIKSDTAPLNYLVRDILQASKDVHVMRDATRGGIASTLNEIAATAKVGIRVDEGKIPVLEEVKGACEILGLDPLYIANEGKLIAIVPEESADKVLAAMRSNENGKDSVVIGEVTDEQTSRVVMNTSIGSSRIVDMISGEQLPRIC